MTDEQYNELTAGMVVGTPNGPAVVAMLFSDSEDVSVEFADGMRGGYDRKELTALDRWHQPIGDKLQAQLPDVDRQPAAGNGETGDQES
jgi:hypothetical protein